ncbi:hypothetical protein RGU70_08455 [Herbaspirillum sp. RTI4]|uniref:hypothetical protein n=1 Tax=Herbaspirillum sp. RTI4 TaxID=3048640 RepID=UPI002AB3A523|nr:hypothetical protein [Herbaspirillum sp. RTI4]MDY7578351.1 hypothetical protein [Herbaspirillum sp. RTI4]MEA9981156.1 hypothetical protein [Herbaspirillum sp. RTI4]
MSSIKQVLHSSPYATTTAADAVVTLHSRVQNAAALSRIELPVETRASNIRTTTSIPSSTASATRSRLPTTNSTIQNIAAFVDSLLTDSVDSSRRVLNKLNDFKGADGTPVFSNLRQRSDALQMVILNLQTRREKLLAENITQPLGDMAELKKTEALISYSETAFQRIFAQKMAISAFSNFVFSYENPNLSEIKSSASS